MRVLPVWLGLGLLAVLAGGATAQEESAASAAASHPRLDRVLVSGNQRVEEDAIRVQLSTRPGQRLDEERVDSDIRAVYRMGFFDRVEADLDESGGSVTLTYRVVERPVIAELHIEGNRKIDREDLEPALKVRPNTIFEPEKVRRGIEEAKKLYEKKGYLDAVIEYETAPTGDHEVILTYKIDEKEVIRIEEIHFEGVRAFPEAPWFSPLPGGLRRVMQTSEAGILSFVTGAGNLDHDVLKTDMERITAYYYDNGYIDVKVDDPIVERKGDGLEVTIKVDEGSQYNVGGVDIGGDRIDDLDQVRARLSLSTGEVFRTSKLREDINAITEAYGDHGYAFVNVSPDTAVNPADHTVDVTYRVSKGPAVSIDKIEISGNSKTRDKVVRREIELEEQEGFSGSKLRRSQERLRRLGFFEDVNITTRKSEKEDRLDLLVDVKEGSTGSFSAGAGVSSGETFLFNLRLSEINLFGRGQRLTLNADFGSIRRNFSIDFTEPYLFDTQVSAGISLFNWRVQFSDFTRAGTGGTLRAFYPLTALGFKRLFGFSLRDTRVGLEYRLEQAEIKDVDSDAAVEIRASQGSNLISSITPRFVRDTRNHPFDPTAGSLQDLSFEYAGLGGNTEFIKAEARGRLYYPFWKSASLGTFVLALGQTFGYGQGFGAQRELPLFERYFPGGINTVRGFRIFSLGPRTIVSDATGTYKDRQSIGGSQQLIFNNEIIFPIVESLGLKGVAFFDAGNAFLAADGIDFDEMRTAAGGGFRWLSPIGPLRIELGYPINPRHGDDEQTFMFSFGGPP